MNFIRKLQWSAGKIILNTEAVTRKRKTVAVGFEGAMKIGILYDASVKENYEVVKNFVRRIRVNQKEVMSLGFINSSKLPGDQFIKLGMDFFTLSHLNWYYKPQSKITTNFIKEPFDILINFSLDECLPLEYITFYSDAGFRIGKYSERNKKYFDFMIDLKPNDKITEFVQQVEHYLQVINTKTPQTQASE